MRCVPGASRPTKLNVAIPLPFTAAVPSTTPLALNVTVPIGDPPYGARTVARIAPSEPTVSVTVGSALAAVSDVHPDALVSARSVPANTARYRCAPRFEANVSDATPDALTAP